MRRILGFSKLQTLAVMTALKVVTSGHLDACSPVAKNNTSVIEHVTHTRAPFSNPFEWPHMRKHSSSLPYLNFTHDSGIDLSMNLDYSALCAKRSAEPATGTCAT
jgi:hypothetical protein